ncbi:MAG: patatin family protein [Clostridia bacterium]|nr:patatin family protein [Clostridia bacterium]
MKTGLILEGGAMRGLFTAGVLDVLMENDVSFDGVIGVSAGAAFGCNYKSKQSGRVLRYNKQYCKDPRYCSFRSLIKTGDLYGADFCYRQLPETLDPFDDATFAADPTEFYVVCTDVATGEPVYQKLEQSNGVALDWLRASASMPLVSTPVEIDGKKMLDGGIADSIPVAYFEKIGYDRNVIILTQPQGYQKKKNSALPLMRLALHKYPAIVKAMQRRHEVYNETLDYIAGLEAEGKALVIRPPQTLQVGHVEHDPERLQTAYDLGRAEGERRFAEIVEFLKG